MEWYQYHDTQGFKWTPSNRRAHSGIDLGVPWNTPVTAAFSGTVVFAACKPWGGQVDILGSYGGVPHVVTVLHLHRIAVSQGQSVLAGQLLGWSGGDGRGPCPTQMPKYSNGPHVHFEMTRGTVGPYHGAAPYTISASSTTVSPAGLLAALRSGGVAGAASGLGALADYLGTDLTVNTPLQPLPAMDALFALPEATLQAVHALPGVDGLIYRLHEAETFPGWKSIDQLAPITPNNVLGGAGAGAASIVPGVGQIVGGILGGAGGAIAGTSAGQAAGSTITAASAGVANVLHPGRIAYWLIGNVLGNLRAGVVRMLYLIVGAVLLIGLLIALGQAQLEMNSEALSDVADIIKPAAEAAAVAA